MATVGYGDITAGNVLEEIICIIWIIFGVTLYSFIIGSLNQILASIDIERE